MQLFALSKKISKSSDNSFIYDFIKNWIKHPEKESNTIYESFIDSYEVHLILDITDDNQLLKKYPIINDKKKIENIRGLFKE